VLSLEAWKSYLFSGGDDNVVRVWSTLSWTCIFLLRAHEDEVWALRVLPDGSLITGSVDATIRVWNVRYRTTEAVTAAVSEENDDASESSPEEAIFVPKIVAWECVQVISSDGPVYSLSYLDNRLISAGASKRISVWHLVPTSASATSTGMSWQILKYFDTVDEGVWSLTVHKKHLISGGCEGTILYWH
jgi:WD40 repeat protein